jgi:pimeloyl-ACP methyl ester carboxylesterase
MILDVNGMELHYDRHGDGKPLVWLHGGLGHGPDWRFIFPSEPPGYQLIEPDLRGHGRSTGARATYSFRQSAVDVIELLDHLRLDRVKVIGLSGGGITALHLATLQPSRVEAMVVISAPPRFPEEARAIQRQYSFDTLPEDTQAQMRERHRRERQIDILFAQIRDPLYPLSLAVELREGIRRSWLWVVPNGGHGPVFGAAAPLFVEIALGFLGGAYR